MQQKSNAITAEYGDRVRFLNTFAPNKQAVYCQDEVFAILDDSPTLTELNNTYGKNTAAMFLVPQLFNISEFCGAKDKFSDEQINETAQLIAATYPWIKVKEFMTFCKQFKLGRYGQFYGSVDPMVITRAFREFLIFRADTYADYEQYKAQKRIEEEKQQPKMSYEEWKAEKEAKGEKVHISLVSAEDRKGTQKTIRPLEDFVDMAERLVTNRDNYSMSDLLAVRKMFREKYGMTPEEVIEKNNNKEL